MKIHDNLSRVTSGNTGYARLEGCLSDLKGYSYVLMNFHVAATVEV